MDWFRRLPKVVRDLIVFNSFIFMIQFILNHGFNQEFVIRIEALMAANAGLIIAYFFRYRVKKVGPKEKS